MKRLHRSDAVINNQFRSLSPLHNCPFCKCRTAGHQLNGNCMTSYHHLSTNPPNLYLTNAQQQDHSTQKQLKHPRLTSILNIPSNKIIFKSSAGVSLKETNISFSYTSPPKLKKHFSSDSRFNTKQYKERHFPQISNHEIDNIPIERTTKKLEGKGINFIYANQKTPEKHKILKLKSEKSQDRMNVGSLKNYSDNDRNDELTSLKQFLPSESTPISALWGKQSDRIRIKPNQYAEVSIPASLQIASRQERKLAQQTQGRSIPIQNKYPTVESLQAYQTPKYADISRQISRKQQASLQYQTSLDSQLAQSIMQELDLHYDYYIPFPSESDKSLSLHVEL